MYSGLLVLLFPNRNYRILSNMLCETCKAIFNQPVKLVQAVNWLDRWSAEYDYTIGFADLEAKAAICYGCNGILREATKVYLIVRPTEILQIGCVLAMQSGEKRSVRLWNRIRFGGKIIGMQTLQFEKVPVESEASCYLICARLTIIFRSRQCLY